MKLQGLLDDSFANYRLTMIYASSSLQEARQRRPHEFLWPLVESWVQYRSASFSNMQAKTIGSQMQVTSLVSGAMNSF
jgi:hypothetical protein